jgi:excisionase family DNA binding protein
MKVRELADFLLVNQCTGYRLAARRRLPGFNLGASWRFKRAVIDGWIAAQSSAVNADTGAAESRAIALGIGNWREESAPSGDTTCVFRESVCAKDIAKAHNTAILSQNGMSNVRSL